MTAKNLLDSENIYHTNIGLQMCHSSHSRSSVIVSHSFVYILTLCTTYKMLKLFTLFKKNKKTMYGNPQQCMLLYLCCS